MDHYQHNKVATNPNASTTRGIDSLDGTNIKMRQPMPSVIIQEMLGTASMPIMTDWALCDTGTDQKS